MHRNTNNTRDGTFAELSKFIELERILRKTRFRAAEPKNVIRFQSLSFLDPLFVFPFDPFVFHGGFSIFLKDFPLDWTILVTETTFIRRNTRSDCFPNATFSFRFYPPIFHYIPPVFSSNVFRFSIGCNDAEASFTTFRNLIRFQKFQFNFFHRSFVSSSKDFPLDRTHSSRCTVTRNKRLCSFGMGVSILRRKWSFFAGRRKRRVPSNGAGI